MIAQLSPRELAAWRDDSEREAPYVLDVRERWEFDHCSIDESISVPLGELPAALGTLPRDRDIVVVCHHGVRSQFAAAWLARAGFSRIHNLAGGVEGWASEVDPRMKRY